MLRISHNLKSNMDRFIGKDTMQTIMTLEDLKSNMDRFIALKLMFKIMLDFVFKIQYG